MNAKCNTSLALALACAFGAFSVAAPAHAVNQIVDISDEATLTQRTAQGTFTVICDAGDTGIVIFDLFQDTGRGTSVVEEGQFLCSGEEQTITYTSTPQRGSFRPGTATATVNLVTCSAGTCIEEARTSEEIQLTR
ncbi:hypothetical protein [Crystallibacter degradans]|uniref:hypothetical protein n=1 Tax=Crystallibacter degradans TaxID=2726743 RepID=UPI001473C83C|nr:hypothetical protein [Arthrobacter sp. SF27]NMR30914.1 hypothetical protein [Arthrobacter sp. SF27]